MAAMTPEQKLDRFVDEVIALAKDRGMTVAVSVSVPTGRMHCARVSAYSPQEGEYGKHLVLEAMGHMIGYREHVAGKQENADGKRVAEQIEHTGATPAGSRYPKN